MKRIMIFGMFAAIMIATSADALFGKEKEVELSEKNANVLLNRIRGEGKLHDIGLAEYGNRRAAAALVIDNAIAEHMTYFLIGELSKKLLLTIPTAVSFVVSPSEVEFITETIKRITLEKAREALNNWLERNMIKVGIGKFGKEGQITYVLSCRHLSQNQGEVAAIFYSGRTLKISTTPQGSVGGMHLRPYIESGKLPCFKITIKGKGRIEQTWLGKERYIWEETIEGPKIEFPKNAPWCEPTLPLPKWKEIPPFWLEEGLATALVMDKSGSMTGEKFKRAQQAAYVYVDTSLEQEDMVSLAAFSSNAESITEPISIAEGREVLKKDILSLSSGGSTNVGAGLTIAFGHLSSCNLKDKKALLMSDGRHNAGTYKPEVVEFQKKGWPISTVAFGKDADQEMLSWIAYQTGGSFFPAESSDIASVYHKINVMAHNGSVYRSYNDFIRTGEKLTYNIPVEPDMKKVGFFTNWQGSRMETILFSPSKIVINRSNISNFGRFVEGETHNCFEIDNPQCGPWQALITGYELPPNGEQVNFHSFCESDVFSNILGFQPRYSQNQKVRIGVKLAEVINGRLLLLRGTRVTAEIKKPSVSLNRFASDIRQKRLQPTTLLEIFSGLSKTAQKITLFDDGLHGDVMPNDGIYANTYAGATINGPYLVTINCQGYTSQGMPVKRTLQESFQVGPIQQNSFTVSDFLGLISQQGAGRQMPIYVPKTAPGKTKEQETQKIIETLLNQFLKKKR